MQQTYLFYDIESTGLHKCFDQVLQFAAIRTDLELNEIERHNIVIKLNPDVIPNPYASITHHISIERTMNEGIDEVTAMEKIHAMFNQPGTISLGYNTLRFDDEFLRFSFYSNLLTPYTHQYANNCSRMDLYPMAIMYYLFKPNVIRWPQKDGKPNMKLEAINEHNKLAEGPAHDALVDVVATLELARKLQKDSAMWNYLCGYFNKKVDQTRRDKLPLAHGLNYQIGLMVHGPLGNKNLFQAPVLCLGQHWHYKNQTIWLRLDNKELSLTDPSADITKTAFTINKKHAELGLLLPLTEKYSKHISAKHQAIIDKNLAWLRDNQDSLQAIANYYLDYKYPEVANVDIDAALYGSPFWTPQDTAACKRFHMAPSSKKAETLKTMRNKNLQQLATRILGRLNPELLPAALKANYQTHLEQVFSTDESTLALDFRGEKRYSLKDAKHDLLEAGKIANLSAQQQQLLQELNHYLESKA